MSQNAAKSAPLRDHLLALVDQELAPHERLPTERELADEFSVSRLTVRRVLDRLERDGRIYRIRGSGTYVSQQRVTKSVELTSFSEDMRARGMVPGSRVVLVERVPAGADRGFALGRSPSALVWHLRRVRTAEALPMALEDAIIPADLLPEDFTLAENQSLYTVLSQWPRLRPDHATQTIRATVLDTESAALLEVAPFSAAFDVERLVMNAEGRAVEFAHSLYRADRYNYEFQINRTDGL